MVHVIIRPPPIPWARGPRPAPKSLCQVRKILCCDYPDQVAAVNALAGSGILDSFEDGTQIRFMDGGCCHQK